MRRTALLAVGLALVLAGRGARAQGEVPLTPMKGGALQAMWGADGAVVERLGPSPKPPPDTLSPPWDPPVGVVSRAKMPRDWAGRFAHVMQQTGDYSRFGRCDFIAAPEDSTAAQRYRVTLESRNGWTVWVRLDFGSGCAHVGTPASPGGSAEMAGMADTLFALVREALRRDPVVSRMTAPPRVPERDPNGGSPRQSPIRGMDSLRVEEFPEALQKVPPTYPVHARSANVQGMVLVQALITKSGRVSDVFVRKSIPLLDQAAIAAVRQWTFKPALYKGVPVAVWVGIPIRFALH